MLKRKRFVEGQIDRVDKQLAQLENVIADVEQAQLNNVVLASLEKGRDALQEINKVGCPRSAHPRTRPTRWSWPRRSWRTVRRRPSINRRYPRCSAVS